LSASEQIELDRHFWKLGVHGSGKEALVEMGRCPDCVDGLVRMGMFSDLPDEVKQTYLDALGGGDPTSMDDSQLGEVVRYVCKNGKCEPIRENLKKEGFKVSYKKPGKSLA